MAQSAVATGRQIRDKRKRFVIIGPPIMTGATTRRRDERASGRDLSRFADGSPSPPPRPSSKTLHNRYSAHVAIVVGIGEREFVPLRWLLISIENRLYVLSMIRRHTVEVRQGKPEQREATKEGRGEARRKRERMHGENAEAWATRALTPRCVKRF